MDSDNERDTDRVRETDAGWRGVNWHATEEVNLGVILTQEVGIEDHYCLDLLTKITRLL